MKKEFMNFERIPIGNGEPNTIVSEIEVTDLPGKIQDVNVRIDLNHSYTSDLRITVECPDGTQVLLVSSEGLSGDNFRRTVFDDAATKTIEGASAPFRGTFRPKGTLTDFENKEARGVWKLIVEDRELQDGGELNHWALSIETGDNVFSNDSRIPIEAGGPNTIESTIDTGNHGGMVVKSLKVLVDLDHTWTGDLKLTLIGPDSTEVVLARKRGGSGDNFDHTLFDDEAESSIAGGSSPFQGSYRPEGNLAAFKGKVVSGVWTLKVEDLAAQDGGTLNRWELLADIGPIKPSAFKIDVKFEGGLTANQRSVFTLAAARWAEVITGEWPAHTLNDGTEVQNLLIQAKGVHIDGVGKVLGRAGPTMIRVPSLFPITGIMEFDTADLADMEDNGTLFGVILHEMGHVLGIGTLWDEDGHNLLVGSGTNNPEYTGTNAMTEYATLIGASSPVRVPVANTGGPGTAEGHWRESTFDHELMTGYVESPGSDMPLSRLTVASLRDFGYEVNMDAANPYVMPAGVAPRAAKKRRKLTASRRSCCVHFPKMEKVQVE